MPSVFSLLGYILAALCDRLPFSHAWSSEGPASAQPDPERALCEY